MRAKGCGIVAVMLVAWLSTGCASWTALSMPGPSKGDQVRVDMPRRDVERLLATGPTSTLQNDGMTEVRYEYADGPSDASKTRAILYAGADVFTLFLSELLFWPIELHQKDQAQRVAVAEFSSDDRLVAWTMRRRSDGKTLVEERSARYDEYAQAASGEPTPIPAVVPLSAAPAARPSAEKSTTPQTYASLGRPAESATKARSLRLGTYHALVIGNDAYTSLIPLQTARADARAMAGILRDRYGYEVDVLLDATRRETVSAIAGYRNRLGPEDNLLIYYAGHGIRDRDEDHGYWLPVDAEPDDPSQWIANANITRQLKAMAAKHVLVIADSCYSGTLTRGIAVSDRAPGYLQRLAERRSRTAMTSGGIEPVSDGGAGSNSVFAGALLRELRENDGLIEASELFVRLRRRVALDSDQTPQYAPITKAGHDDGEFLFAVP